jgi:hypothetical protein
MSLDAPKSDAELLRLHEQRTRGATKNGVALGPGSPLRPDPRPRERHHRSPSQPDEHEIQVAFFANIDDEGEQKRRPALAFVFAVPNGGKRAPAVAAKLKAEGVRRGVPDVWCPVPRDRYCGLVIEFKRPGAATTPEQADWLAALARVGWCTQLHTIPTEAFRELCDYLDLPPRTSP